MSSAIYYIHASDVDNDGHTDLYFGAFNEWMKMYFGDGYGDFILAWENLLEESGFSGHIVDVNQDGCMDIVAGERGIVRIFEND